MNGEFTIALHALVYLNHVGKIVSSEALAENVCTNPARVRKVMAKLKKAGIISTKEGIDGGYLFDGNPRTLMLNTILDALELPVLSPLWHSGSSDLGCQVSAGMADVMDDLYEDLEMRCRHRLSCISLSGIERRIFTKKG